VASLDRTYKVNICGFLILAVSLVSSLPIFAEPITIEEISAEYETFLMEKDFMKDFDDLGDCMNETIKIYSEDYRLVRCGSEKNAMITDLLKRADFLADVNGTQIYRLNK